MTETIRITKEIGIDAGHRVPGHLSKCRNPHGHRYRIIAHCVGNIVETPGAPDEGMLVDFGDVKTILMEEVDAPLDHGFIVYKGDKQMISALTVAQSGTQDELVPWKVVVFPYIPTAENIARWIYERVQPRILARFPGDTLELAAIEVWETPTSMAIYGGPE